MSLNCFAGHQPTRWYTMPINVYIPEHSKAPLMKKAFLELENSTNLLKFRFLPEQRKNKAHIVISFVKSCNYENAVGLTYSPEKRYAFYKNSIKIGLFKLGTNQRYSDKDLYVIMLHEAGHAIGMKHSTNPKDIMYYSLNSEQKALTQNDIKQILILYR